MPQLRLYETQLQSRVNYMRPKQARHIESCNIVEKLLVRWQAEAIFMLVCRSTAVKCDFLSRRAGKTLLGN